MSQPKDPHMPELSRSLQPRHITMISIGGMIGAGLFVSSSAAIAATGPAIVISYLITGTLVLLVMRMLGEMALTVPTVRSFTEFARVGLGNWGGFLAGWLYWYFWMIVVPVEAIAGANILHGWTGLPPLALGLMLMGVMTAVNLMSARSYGEFEFWFASIKVAAIIAFIALAAAFAFGFTSGSGPTFGNLTQYGGFMPKNLVAVLSGAVTVYFSLTGAEITTIAAAESKEPARAVARMSSTVIVRILGIADRLGGPVGAHTPGRVALHARPHRDAFQVGEHGDERHHPHGRAFLPQLGLLRVLARAVCDGRAR
jgi:GABA permease